jgi:hypothetical protein
MRIVRQCDSSGIPCCIGCECRPIDRTAYESSQNQNSRQLTRWQLGRSFFLYRSSDSTFPARIPILIKFLPTIRDVTNAVVLLKMLAGVTAFWVLNDCAKTVTFSHVIAERDGMDLRSVVVVNDARVVGEESKQVI